MTQARRKVLEGGMARHLQYNLLRGGGGGGAENVQNSEPKTVHFGVHQVPEAKSGTSNTESR